MFIKIDQKLLKKLEKMMMKGEVPSGIKPMGPDEVLPISVQTSILKTTRSFLEEKEKGRNGFREQISHQHFTRKILIDLQEEMVNFGLSLINTFTAVDDAMTMINAELDSRDIGKEPPDSVLISDEKKRCERFEKFKAKFAKKKGKLHGSTREAKRKNRRFA